jgi:hypothetical protein
MPTPSPPSAPPPPRPPCCSCPGPGSVSAASYSTVAATGSATYGVNLNCTVVITNPSGWAVGLSFSAFVTEPGADVLRVFDGTSTSAPVLAQWSGTLAAGLRVAGSTCTCVAAVSLGLAL